MSLLSSVRELFESPERTDPSQESNGAYWCHDCSERVLDLDVEGDQPPDCPDCGEEMDFERANNVGCAC